MAIFNTSLIGLDETAVADQRTLLTQQMHEAYPQQDTRFGVLHDTILEVWAALQTLHNSNLQRLQSSMTLLGIAEDPTLATDEIVDGLLSNYGLTRQEGAAASGNIVMVVNALTPISIGAGVQFVANGVTFATEAAYAARISSASVTADTDRLLTPVGDGTYSFSFPVVALTPGTQGMLRKNTRLTTDLPLGSLVKVYAESDFIGGTNTETNAELIGRLNAGWAIKAWSNRISIEALIRHQDAFKNIVAVSVIGHGDTEMTRDQHGLLPISQGGRTDLYVRTQGLHQSKQVTATATYIGRSENGGLWQLLIARDQLPGCYRVRSITAAVAGSVVADFAPLVTSRSFSLPDTRHPDIETAQEAAFSTYQVCSVQFVDTLKPVTGLTVGDTADYLVTLQGLPLIDELQTFCLRRDVGPAQCDVLVKAAVPCLVSLTFAVYLPEGGATVDQPAVKTALAAFVNSTGFSGSLYAAALQRVAAEAIPGDVNLGRIEMTGSILRPDGTTTFLRDFDILRVTAAGDVSEKTVCFFLDPSDIVISLKSVN